MHRVAFGTAKDVKDVVTSFGYEPWPPLDPKGARVRIQSVGMCLTNRQAVISEEQARLYAGVKNSAVFYGYEAAGIVEEIGDDVKTRKNGLKTGDRVLIWAANEELECQQGSYAEFVTMANADSLLKVPESISTEVAAALPTGGVIAMTAVLQSEADVYKAIKSKGHCDFLIMGGGALALWTLKLVKFHFARRFGKNLVKVFVLDEANAILQEATECGADGVIAWDSIGGDAASIDHALSLMRNKRAQIVYDLSTTEQTLSLALRCLDQSGVVFTGGLTGQPTKLSITELNKRRLAIKGIGYGSMDDLKTLIKILADKKVTSPPYKVFSFDDAKAAWEGVVTGDIHGRAVLRFSKDESSSTESISSPPSIIQGGYTSHSRSAESSDPTTIDIPSTVLDEMESEFLNQPPPLPVFSPYFPIDSDVFPPITLQSYPSGRILVTSEETIRVQQLENDVEEDRTLKEIDEEEESEEVIVEETEDQAAVLGNLDMGDLDKRV